MRSARLAATFFMLVPLWGDAQSHVHPHSKPANTAPITITINPESRVSATVSRPFPSVQCGSLTNIPIGIINQSFSTLRLEASLVGDSPSSEVAIDFHPEPLKGTPKESLSLGIMLSRPGPVDITISFGARRVAHDLGGRDRIHFMMRCVPSA